MEVVFGFGKLRSQGGHIESLGGVSVAAVFPIARTPGLWVPSSHPEQQVGEIVPIDWNGVRCMSPWRRGIGKEGGLQG